MREGLLDDLAMLRDALVEIERRFDPGQPRDGDGRWTDGTPLFSRTVPLSGGGTATVDRTGSGNPRLTIGNRTVELSTARPRSMSGSRLPSEVDRVRSMVVNAQYDVDDGRSEADGVYRVTRDRPATPGRPASTEILVSLRPVPGRYVTDDGRTITSLDQAGDSEAYNDAFDLVIDEDPDGAFDNEPSVRVSLDDLEQGIQGSLAAAGAARRVDAGFGPVDVHAPGNGRIGFRTRTDDGDVAEVEFTGREWRDIDAAIYDVIDGGGERFVDTAAGRVEVTFLGSWDGGRFTDDNSLLIAPASGGSWSIGGAGPDLSKLLDAMSANSRAAGIERSAAVTASAQQIRRHHRIERRFNPDQPRDGDGRWTDGLSDRINLGARDRLVSSKRYRPGRGAFGDNDVEAGAAIVEGPRGREVRLGVISAIAAENGGPEPWDADTGRADTVSLNRRALRKLRNDLAEGLATATANPDGDGVLAEGSVGGVAWSMYPEDDDAISVAVEIDPEVDSLVLDAKQAERFLRYLDDLDAHMGGDVTRHATAEAERRRRFDPSQPRDGRGQWTEGLSGAGGGRHSAPQQPTGTNVNPNPAASTSRRPESAAEAEARKGTRDPRLGDTVRIDTARGPKGEFEGRTGRVMSRPPASSRASAGMIVELDDGLMIDADRRNLVVEEPYRATEAELENARQQYSDLYARMAEQWQNRSTTRPGGGLIVPTNVFNRTFALDDIQIQRSGDGRTVEAYAAMFEAPYEVRDQHGHYLEVIDRAAFNRTLSGGAGKHAMCLYNHGMNVIDGKPDSLAQVPLGTPLEIRPDGRGLLTVTRYNKSALADAVLESIRNGDVRSQSFRGRIVRSSPNGRVPRARTGQALPTVIRHELGLSDYGPTPVPVNVGAEIVAVRSVQDLMHELSELTVDERDELLRSLGLPTHGFAGDPGDEDYDEDPLVDISATSAQPEPGAEDPPAARSATHSGRLELKRAVLQRALELRGVSRGQAA